MFCIYCFHEDTSVSNSRPHKKRPSVWRRRKCSRCKKSFTTLEQPQLGGRNIHTKNGPVPFNIGRLTVSIANAFAHDPLTGKEQAYWLAQSVEATLASEHPQITLQEIEAITHQTLKRFDEVAATQYALKHQLIVSASKRRGRPSLVSRDRATPQ
jgi:transcriptional repressor NrdR